LLQRAVKNPEICQEIALARFQEFGEISMFYEKYVYSGAEGTADIIVDIM
jgi:hypothetical protein